MSYVLTPLAQEDILEIWWHIAQDNLTAADRVETAVYAACSMLGRNPMMGHVREDLPFPDYRFWTIRRYTSYLVVYDPRFRPIHILRVLHGARNLPEALRRS